MQDDTAPHRVVVTGAFGFVGAYVVAALSYALGPNSSVYLCKRDEAQPGQQPPQQTPQGAGLPQFHTVAFPIEEPDRVDQAIRDIAPTALIHLAAIAEPLQARQDPSTAWRVNFDGVRNIADAILRHAPGCRFVFASTAEVYGESFRASGQVTETALLQPTTVYGATKACAEVFLSQRARDGLDCVRMRAFNHTGAGQTPAYVVPTIARQLVRIERGEQPPVLEVGNIDGARDFLDVRDVARAYVMAATANRPASVDAVYNIGRGAPTILRDLISEMCALTTVPVTVQQDPKRMRPGELALVSANIDKARRDLGWSPEIPLKETLGDVLDYWRTRPELG